MDPGIAGVLGGAVRPRPTAYSFVFETLRQGILDGAITGGTRLVQAEIAEMLDVSTTPVREALRDLASEGLIRLDPHRGAVVHELTRDELLEMYEIRRVLEPEALRRAVDHIDEAGIEAALSIHEKMLADPESDGFSDLNRAFHLSIYDSAGSPRLAAILRGLFDTSAMYVRATMRQQPDLRKMAIGDHAAIIDALRARDTEGAITVIERHMRIPHEVFARDQRE
ncbi:MAG TPA: GntR family transcriptional regulator [Acidimicrobiia bacterium]